MYERHADKRLHSEAAALHCRLVRAAIGDAELQRLQVEGAKLREDIAGIALAMPNGEVIAPGERTRAWRDRALATPASSLPA